MTNGIPTVGTIPTAEAVIPTVAPVETAPVATVTEVSESKPKKLSMTKKWDGSDINQGMKALYIGLKQDINRKDDIELHKFLDLVREYYQPKTGQGGGGFDKDWTRRIENSLGEVVAKMDSASGFWFVANDSDPKKSAMSKGKYTSKKMLKLGRDIEELIQAELVTLAMQGQVLTDTKKLTLLSADTDEDTKFGIIREIYPTEFNQVVADYSTEQMYLGATKEEANTTLIGQGVQTVLND